MSEKLIEKESYPSTEEVLKFIQKYRALENSSYEMANGHIQKMLSPKMSYSTIIHLCGHWKGKSKNFASWYLNLGTQTQIFILQSLGIVSDQDDKWLSEFKRDEMTGCFMNAPDKAGSLNSLILFFHNNAVDEGTFNYHNIPTTGINFPTLLKKQYGNSANWGDFILANCMIDASPLLPDRKSVV